MMKQDLQNHLESQHKKMEDKRKYCKECGFIFETSEEWKMHLVDEHHTKMAKRDDTTLKTQISFAHLPIGLKVSPFGAIKEQVEQNLRKTEYGVLSASDTTESKGTFKKCHLCDYATHRSDHFRFHQNFFHQQKMNCVQKCPHCDYATNRTSVMSNHVKKVHTKTKCLQCDYVTDISDLFAHLNSVHNNINNKTVKQSSGLNFVTNTLKDVPRPAVAVEMTKDHKCVQCNLATASPANLSRHIREVHNKIKNISCTHCNDFSTGSTTDLSRHIKAVHNKVKDIKCPHCDYFTSRSSSIKQHINAVHLNIKDKRCIQCDFATSRAGRLTEHVKAVHNKISDIQCPICNFASSRRENIRAHVKSVHGMSMRSVAKCLLTPS
jgi:hypothetical protein